MKESYGKDPASHPGPESCIGRCKAAGEALTGGGAGPVLSCENYASRTPTLLSEAEGNIVSADKGKAHASSTQSKTRSMHGHFLRGNREIPATPELEKASGRVGKATSFKPTMHVAGKSDERVVPKKQPNKDDQYQASAEVVEGRRSTEGNMRKTTALRTQGRDSALSGLTRVREAARRDKHARFTNLLHHVTIDLLWASFYALKKQAAPGVDGLTWQQYEIHAETRLRNLNDRVHRGTYRAQPSKRTYIPKADGKMRPLGVAALEDKIVQHAVATVLNAVYEVDFIGFSYGFRPGRHQHMALDALWVGLMKRKVNWVLDADIRGFFDNINHEWVMKFVEHRIADPRLLRLIRKWLTAGVSEDGKWSRTDVGTPQGAVISPLLANVFLHYVFDLWVDQWRRKFARGEIIVVRYADDFVMGFQHKDEAETFLKSLHERFGKFGLGLHPDKTRLIEFGRFAAIKRQKRGLGKPESFNFLGFTHFCGRMRRSGEFIVKRITIAKRMTAKLKVIKETLMRIRHEPVAKQGTWLSGVVRGYFNYHAIPGNGDRIVEFRTQVNRLWFRALHRRSQRARLNWARFGKLVDLWIPKPRILHPHPNVRFYAMHPK
ncbi:MAG: group II intron reverse transcriptase/maturase [Terriglobia bacterium]